MKQTMTTNEVAAALRADDNANWSYAGALALAEYLEEWERESASEMEFDRVAIRCDFAEWKSLQAWAVDYFGGEKQAKEEKYDIWCIPSYRILCFQSLLHVCLKIKELP